MAKRVREVSGDRINFAGIYNQPQHGINRPKFIDVSKDPYFVAIGAEESIGNYVVNPLVVLDFCAVIALFFLGLFWVSK